MQGFEKQISGVNPADPDVISRPTEKQIERAKKYFLALARRAEAKPTDAEVLSAILSDRISEYWESALAAAMQAAESLDSGQAYPVIDEIIAKYLREKQDLQLVAELYNRLPLDTVLLRQTSLEVFRQTVHAMEERGRVELYPVEYLTVSLNYAQRLLQAGSIGEAETVTQKILHLARDGHHRDPEKYFDALISSLETWAIIRADKGYLQDCRTAREEAIALLRATSGQKRNLAQSLNNYAGTLRAFGDLSAAVQNSLEAVNIYREAGNNGDTDFSKGLQAWQDDSLPNLGLALIGLSNHQYEAKQYEESMASAKEAYDIVYMLHEEFPDQFRYHLGMAHHNLGMVKFAVGDASGGLIDIEEAANIYERLVKLHPDSYLPDYAHILGSLARAYAKNDRDEECLVQMEKSANIYRELVKKAPDRFENQLIGSLINLKIIYEDLAQTEKVNLIVAELAELESKEKNQVHGPSTVRRGTAYAQP